VEIEQEVKNGTLILRLSGELDLKTASDFRSTIERGLLGPQLRNVVVNLSAVSFIDSSGIGVLLGRYKELSQLGGQLVLVGVKPHVKTLLELSGLSRVIPFAVSEAEALELVAAGRGDKNV
jgi:stage II sporulation protein AA (anti-sigma F factor antagonist)